MRRLLRTLALILLIPATVYAATYVAFESITVTTSTPIGFTSSKINATGSHLAATQAMCMVSSAAISYMIDGTTTVTSATGGGIPAAVGTPIYLAGNDVLQNFRAESAGAGSSILNCIYSRP